MTSQQTVKQKTSNRNIFSDHDYNFLHFKKNNKNPIFEQSEANKSRKLQMKGPKKALHSFFFNDQQRSAIDRSENFPFFNKL